MIALSKMTNCTLHSSRVHVVGRTHFISITPHLHIRDSVLSIAGQFLDTNVLPPKAASLAQGGSLHTHVILALHGGILVRVSHIGVFSWVISLYLLLESGVELAGISVTKLNGGKQGNHRLYFVSFTEF